jgi:uncharacterized membrane protein
VLPLTVDTVRLSLHVLAATVWVGGQFVLAGLLPSLRRLGDDAPRTVARAFNRIAWPAFAVLVATGSGTWWSSRSATSTPSGRSRCS